VLTVFTAALLDFTHKKILSVGEIIAPAIPDVIREVRQAPVEKYWQL
jgi:hypothetical protein